MDKLLSYYREAITSRDPDVPYIESSNDLFGFNGSTIPTNIYEKIFQRFQLEMGRSQNVIAAFDIWLEDKLPRQIRNYKLDAFTEVDEIIYFDNIKIYKPFTKDRNLPAGNIADVIQPGDLPPVDNIRPLFPRDAIILGENYSSQITVDIYARKRIYESEYDTRLLKANVIVGEIPILKGSKYCWLRNMTDTQKVAFGECFNDPLGYFIIGGMEKVMLSEEKSGAGRMVITNWPSAKGVPSIRMYSLITTSSISIDLLTDPKNNNLIEVIFNNRPSFPVLILSLFLQYLHDPALVDSSSSYEEMVETCNTVLKRVITPEILDFVPDSEKPMVRSRLASTTISTRTLIEKEIINETIDKKTLNPLKVFSNLIDSFSSHKSSKSITRAVYQEMVDEIKINVFPSFEDDSLVRPSSDNFDKRRFMLSKMISVYVRFLVGYREEDDRDSFLNKRVSDSTRQLEKHFNIIFKKSLKDFKVTSLSVDSREFTKEFLKKFKPEGGGGRGNSTPPEQLARDTPASVYSQLRKITVPNTKAGSKTKEPRYIQPTQIGFICSGETPESSQVGTTKHLTTTCWVSIARDVDLVEDAVSKYLDDERESLDHLLLLINGDFHGWLRHDLYSYLKTDLKTNLDTFDVSVELNYIDRHINIITTGSILTRPLLTIDMETGRIRLQSLASDEIESLSINDLITRGYLEFNSPGELDSIWPAQTKDDPLWKQINKGMTYVKIAEYVEDVGLLQSQHASGNLLEEQPYTHAELIPHFQFGISSASVPKANSNKGPRVTYQSSMFKQALTGYHSDHVNRFDSGYKLHQAPTRTMFETITHQPLGLNAMPSTTSPVVAIYVKPSNNEDALVAKREYLDNSLRFVYYPTIKILIDTLDIIDVRPDHDNDPKLHALYKRSDNVPEEMIGYPKLGSFLRDGDAVLGRYRVNIVDNVKINKPNHCYVLPGKGGYVVGVEVSRQESGLHIKIKIAQYRRQILGDKVASRYSQKGTVGQIVSEKDLPRIVGGPNDGVVPDFFFNSHSVPSRLTQGMIIEFLANKGAVYTGKRMNASPFGEYLNDSYMESIESVLAARGLQPDGVETMRFPDGTLVESKIYVGVCAYQALRHHVAEKFQFRNIGNYNPDTHQPVSGRPKGGGLKNGEMERDAMVSHGTAHVVLDRMMESSDLYKIIVCKNCGNLVPSNFDPRTVTCKCCPGENKFGVLTLPYIAHHLIRIINAAGLHIHYRF